jgi:hypothetical protein
VGRRKAAPRKKKEKVEVAATAAAAAEVEVEVDDDGKVIDPDEPRYCICNRVSFGTMINCDNEVGFKRAFLLSPPALTGENAFAADWPSQNCELQWFHLDCVGLENIPARTTKWYCPDCRKALGLGEKGEVSARGVKA